MIEPSDDITKEYVKGFGLVKNEKGEDIKQHKMRVMSPKEIEVRGELNIKNTTENLRKCVLEYQAKADGNAGYISSDRPLDERCDIVHWHEGRCTLGKLHKARHLASNGFEW